MENADQSGRRGTALQQQIQDPHVGPLKKYMGLVVGSNSLWRFLYYEFVMTFVAPWPGALGFVLRRIFFRPLFRRMGRGVVLGRSLTIRFPGKMEIGDNVVIDDYCVLDGNGDAPATIRIANNAIIGRNTILTCKGGQIEIGPNTNLSANCEIHSRSRVSVGADVLFAAHCYLVGGQHKFDRLDVPVIEQGTAAEGIRIGNGCWLGTTVTVTDGVEIGDNTVIGAHSLVNRSLPAGVIAFGAPAKVVRQRDDAGHLPQKQ